MGMNDTELMNLAKTVIKELNANSMKEMGNVMKVMMERVMGQAPNDAISRVVRDLLQKQ